MSFQVDSRIQESSFFLVDWPLSRLFLKNNSHFPWLILVPREKNITEIHQLSSENRRQLMDEITEASRVLQAYFNPHKLNVGSLGNIVAQLHIHVVGRFEADLAWPHGIWQPLEKEQVYSPGVAAQLINDLRDVASYSNWGSGF
ncbi:HIT domain-containing protein [Legionella jordanis]|uniref:Diadenosine tetraphosphate (Ap4A) hydrolase-like HIT family hydrolase n=1 Tax=Legionella jordanis TaxID=456 RepID=A0A0W0VEV1_9GAMM|nr:HIT domain-containing protein [Legionella jordanis]KTD18342.1 diadenosine tetraphosphate (Ap4A) hydrolase-like HIT family hydrolase [Legionella jordanis]RMX05254.1 HIT domain-containing protein [Legionella jordanis]RMX20895.1 HIT domain-containing protein [Legionella jordanis]VEH13312.1 diadenosine tetraphosphate (Ap4A) hydrolase-like HIT family hydrolase [Legionella jordanis]HAT8713660.1 HIT domain-containing protein [Legionella jordanis]